MIVMTMLLCLERRYGKFKKNVNFSKKSTLDASHKYSDVGIAQSYEIVHLKSLYELISTKTV